jgi:hypothetical protein
LTTVERSPALPDIPTVASFVPGYEASTFFGLSAPRATPPEIVDQLSDGRVVTLGSEMQLQDCVRHITLFAPKIMVTLRGTGFRPIKSTEICS